MDAALQRELVDFSPRWSAPHERLSPDPSLPWLTVLLDNARDAEPQLAWALLLVRSAQGRLQAMHCQPPPFEVWLENSATVGPEVQGISRNFSDGIARIALARNADIFCVAHEVAHFLAAAPAPPWPHCEGVERATLILLEEHIAQRLGVELLMELPPDNRAAVAMELAHQAANLGAGYRRAREAFRTLITTGAPSSNLAESVISLSRTLAYLTGISSEAWAFTGLPIGLRRAVTTTLAPALARIDLRADLDMDRRALAERLDLTSITTDLFAQIVSNASMGTAREQRHPGWLAAFGLPRSG